MASQLYNSYFQQQVGGGTSSSHGGVGHHPISYPQQTVPSFSQPLSPFNGGLGAAAPALPEWSRLYNANNQFDPTGGALGQQSNQTLANVMGSNPLGNYSFNPLNASTAQQQLASTSLAQALQSQAMYANAAQAGPASLASQQTSALPTALNTPDAVNSPNVLNQSNINDWFNKSVANPAMLNYQQNIAPTIDSQFAGQGGIFNSRRGYTQAQALNQMNTNEVAQLANTSLNLNQLQAQMQNTDALQHNADLINVGQFNNNQALNNNQFNASQGNQLNMYNAGQQNQMSQFNTGQQNAINQFNAQLGTQNNQYNAQLGTQANEYNAGQLNATSQFNAGQGNQLGEFNATQQNNMGQFNANMLQNQAQLQMQAQQQQMQAAALAQQNINNNQNRLAQQFNMNSAVQNENNYTMQGQYNEMLRTQPYNNPYVNQAMQFMNMNQQTQLPYTQPSLGAQLGQGLGLGMLGQSMGLLPSASGLGALASGDASLSFLGLGLL